MDYNYVEFFSFIAIGGAITAATVWIGLHFKKRDDERWARRVDDELHGRPVK